ncbi:MAG: AraC family transcriptional regulator [Salinivirgaceae bacterium]|nr:AraC family transcriptional regulator [Salinivirgaceae bacterium]
MKPEIKKYKFKHGLPVEFEIINIADLIREHKTLLTSPHRADFYHIIWIQKGSPTHFVDFNPITIHPNSILFVPKDCVNSFDTSTDYDGKVILFTSNFFCKNYNDIQFLQSTILYNNLYGITQIQTSDSPNDLKILIETIETELLKTNDYAQHDILRNYLHNFLLSAERVKLKQGFNEIKASADLDYLLLFKDLLERNYKTDKSVNKYASDLSISEKRLNKATSNILDKTPKELIDERVLLEAKRLLAYSNTTIKEIAFGLGFEESTNFIKYFKKHIEQTPSEFREKHL